MSALAIIALLQSAVYGPPAPASQAQQLSENASSSCPEADGDEIVVCARRDPGRPQGLEDLSAPERKFDKDERGLFRLKLGDKIKANGGGPKTSVGAGVKIRF
tara:strand:+ start:623 stop:931 length:309 start_codon:yes stop_codon:yes gene_type:complete